MSKGPELSLVVPLFNEERNVERVAASLAREFEAQGLDYELVLVVNGSQDGTPAEVERLARANSRIRPVRLEQNAGYGGGILAGLARCQGEFIGYTWGDGQVSAADHVAIFLKLKREGLDLCKACRVERHDGWRRKVVTRVYNFIFPLLFRVSSGDSNGCPKIFRHEAFLRLQVTSRDWFIDPEIMIKSQRLGLAVGEVRVVFHAREHGASNVGLKTIVEFVRNMIRYRVKGI